jgi:hypothetical protein
VPAVAPAGYSGTPLPRKLGIRDGATVAFLDAPDHFEGLLLPRPEDLVVRTSLRGRADVVVAFFRRRAALRRRVDALGRTVFPDGSIWVAWPKRASGVPTDVTEDVVREEILPKGLVDVKVAAIDETWSGLKLMWRKNLRG